VGAVEVDQRSAVDELDHRRDHDRCERCLGEVFEEPGEHEQREDRERGDDQTRELGSPPAEPLTAVFERLPFTTMPLESPAAMFAPPRPSSSRFASIS
jgi:hypothetical protein